MGILDKYIRNGSSSLSTDGKQAIFTKATDNEGFTPTETEIAMKKMLAYFNESIHDEDIEAIDFDKIMQRVFVPQTDNEGNILYMRNAEGNIRVDGNGSPIPLFKEARQIDNFNASLAIMSSHLNRLSFVNPKNVRLYKLLAEDIVSDILMNSDRDELDSGKIAYLNAKLHNLYIQLDDAANGRKLTALLTVKKEASQDINVRNQAKENSRSRWF